jgi:predicted dehydrogenase
MIRVGILGAAKIAPRALLEPVRERKDAKVTCVAARDPARARLYADENGIENVAADYAALVARDDLDLVYVALPASGHAEWSIKALQAGKAVLCEKPFAMNAAEAQAMVAAGEKAGLPLIEAYHYRYHPVMVETVRLIRDGAIGRLIDAEAAFNVPIPFQPTELRWLPETGGGALMDLGCYPLHALRSAMGEEPKVVSASMVMSRGVDETTEATFAFPAGVTATLSTSMAPGAIAARLFLRGETGSIEIINYVAPQMGCRFTLTQGGKATEMPVDPRGTYAWQFDHVMEVLEGRAVPLTGGADAIATMTAIDAIRAAAAA